MRKLKQKDKQNRLIIQQNELDKFILKSLVKNTNFLHLIRWNACLILSDFSKNNSKNRLTDRCYLTGRKQKFHHLYLMSRLQFLKLARYGSISGIRKAAW